MSGGGNLSDRRGLEMGFAESFIGLGSAANFLPQIRVGERAATSSDRIHVWKMGRVGMVQVKILCPYIHIFNCID